MTDPFQRVAPDVVMARLRPPALKEWAFLDLREPGEAAEGHAFGSVNLPYSRLEQEIAAKVPLRGTDLLLIDGGDGVAERAGKLLSAAGWQRIAIVTGGIPAWEAAGLPLFKGVHTFSKAFGEWVQEHFQTPEITPAELHTRLASPSPPLLIDGRPFAEHHAFTLPGAVNCPNADLAQYLPGDLPPEREVVVHCAGRTRSIIGAQTLRDFGLPHAVYALRDGTQGWELAGHSREIGAARPIAGATPPAAPQAARERALQVMAGGGIGTVTRATLLRWLREGRQTVYRFDVGDDTDPPPGFARVDGTTLIQQTDQYVAVRGARVVLHDPVLVRAVFAALWLCRMGIAAFVLEHSSATLAATQRAPLPPALRAIDAPQLAAHINAGALAVDMRASAAFGRARLAGSVWCPRPRLDRLPLPGGAPVVLIASDPDAAACAGADLAARGHPPLGVNTDGPDDWAAAGLVIEEGGEPLTPADRIDTVRFCAGRHSGNLQDARDYLDWEQGLVARLAAAGLVPWPTQNNANYHSGANPWP